MPAGIKILDINNTEISKEKLEKKLKQAFTLHKYAHIRIFFLLKFKGGGLKVYVEVYVIQTNGVRKMKVKSNR